MKEQQEIRERDFFHSLKDNLFFDHKMETLPRDQLEGQQAKLLRQTLHYAMENSPFYKKRFKQIGLNPGELQSVQDLQKTGFFTTKEDLRENYPFGMLALSLNQVAELHATSGTTGTPTLAFHTSKDLDDWAEISARSLAMSGLTRDDVFQITPS